MKAQSYAPIVLRLALAAVFAWFGTSQWLNPSMWVGIVPSWATGLSGMSASTIVHLNGTFEIIAALLLAVGVWVRWVALLLALHLFVIAANFGFTSIGIRDFGLSFSTLAVSLFGGDDWSLTRPRSSTL